MLASAGAQIAPNFTGRSVMRCATCQSAVYSSGPRLEFALDHPRLIRLLHLPQDLARTQSVPAHPAARGIAMALDAGDALDRIEEPRFAPDREIEPAVAVGDDVEARRLLRIDDRRDRIEVLLAEHRFAERRFERTAVQA